MIDLLQYKREMEIELSSILAWWEKITIDLEHGGFVGRIDHKNMVHPEAPKGSVLNSRILWAFSSAFNRTGESQYLTTATRAFQYITQFFVDKKFGGVYWTVDYEGKPLDTKKQIYALAFAVYGLSEFYLASDDDEAKGLAISLYHDIVAHSYDDTHGGYIEALTREWEALSDLRLSDKDANEKKSMNTHLHLLEAFSNLYRVWKDDDLRRRVIELIHIFRDRIINPVSGHLEMFFDDKWNAKTSAISFGHDVEASWLIQEAAEMVGDNKLLESIKPFSILLAKAATEGVDGDGGIWYEYNQKENHWIRQKHSWPQAEAMVGFFDAWQITGDEEYYQKSWRSWKFVKEYMHDKALGEWFWGVNSDHSPMVDEDKVGVWKCPYHNSRACIEIIKRIDNSLKR